jgi:hypothetical protein
MYCDKTTGAGPDNAFSLVYHSMNDHRLYDASTICNSGLNVIKKYNIANGQVLFDQDVDPGSPWHLEIWSDKCANILGCTSSNIGGIFIFSDSHKRLGYNPLVTGQVFGPGEGSDPRDCISFRMENSGSSYKMLTRWVYQGQVFLGAPIGGWNG